MKQQAVNVNAFVGLNIIDALPNKYQKNVFLANYRQMKANYGDNVDGELLDKQILFCSDTVDYLYGEEFRKTKYVKGSRPQLEKAVYDLTENAKTDLDKVLRILRFCRDLYKKNNGTLLFFGGSEEDLIKKGEQLCECLARLMVALCEIIGVAGRIITHIVGGHLTCELFIDGSWGYFDPRAGLYFVKENGKIASLNDLVKNPSIIDNQPEYVKAELSPRWTYKQRIDRCKVFFGDKEINTIKPYSLSVKPKYHYNWLFFNDLWDNGINAYAVEYQTAINAILGVEEKVRKPYFEFSVKNGQLLSENTRVIVLPRETVAPPTQIEAFIDGVKVWASEKTVNPNYIFSPVNVEFLLFGENAAKIIGRLNKGVHELKVTAVGDADFNGTVLFEI